MNDYLNKLFAGNPIKSWIITVAIIAFSFALLKVFRNIVLFKLKKWVTTTKSRFDDFIIITFEKNIFPFFLFPGHIRRSVLPGV